ncbi:MAG: hypothetical protein MZW92_46560 [Comamonadaceae bacterium]|nr:hypothetical protein [Comamonadaceae bacterium]
MLLEHAFYDQQGVLVKKLVTSRSMRPMGGKLVAGARAHAARRQGPGVDRRHHPRGRLRHQHAGQHVHADQPA